MTTLRLNDLVADKSKLDVARICAGWGWLLASQEDLIYISLAGDLFFCGAHEEINWLNTGSGDLIRVADNLAHFQELCEEPENLDYWFLASSVEELGRAGLVPGAGQVFGYKLLPLLGGDYSTANRELADAYLHFSLSGLICEQTKDVPEGMPPEPI